MEIKIKICSPIKFLFWNFTYIATKDCLYDITFCLFFILKEWLASFELGNSMNRKKCHLWGEVILCYVTTSILLFLVNLIVKLNKWEWKKVGENFCSTYQLGKRPWMLTNVLSFKAIEVLFRLWFLQTLKVILFDICFSMHFWRAYLVCSQQGKLNFSI